MHIGSLLINNGIMPIMTEYTENDVKNITDTNEYKLVKEYGIAFKELDCSKHDKEIYNKAIDEAMDESAKAICIGCGYLDGHICKYKGGNCSVSKPMLEVVAKALGKLKAGGENEI